MKHFLQYSGAILYTPILYACRILFYHCRHGRGDPCREMHPNTKAEQDVWKGSRLLSLICRKNPAHVGLPNCRLNHSVTSRVASGGVAPAPARRALDKEARSALVATASVAAHVPRGVVGGSHDDVPRDPTRGGGESRRRLERTCEEAMANIISEISNGLVMGGGTLIVFFLIYLFILTSPLLTKQIPKLQYKMWSRF